MATFAKWIDTFLAEKGIDGDMIVTAKGKTFGDNMIPVECLVDLMKSAPAHEQNGIKAQLVRIDFVAPGPQPVLDYFGHLAQAVAI